VRLLRISLSNYRNYAHLDLSVPAGMVLIAGENAQGKTNLLEAIYMLATTRSLRASNDVELIRRDSLTDPLAAARIIGTVERDGERTQIEVGIARREQERTGVTQTAHATKRLRVNGIPQRAASVVGRLLAVFFTSMDIDLVTGPPSGRRRYLDITLSQVDHGYLRALQRYNRIVQQRNSLLRQIDEGRAGAEQLQPWDDELIAHGATVVTGRARALARLHEHAAVLHTHLSDDREHLAISYQPQLGGDAPGDIELTDVAAVREQFERALERRRAREIAAGVSLIGPHRDDLGFSLDGQPAATFGSRAQQRTVALALRLAEARLLKERSGDAPILLLDDILSELDERRRHAVLDTLTGTEQALITTADLDRFGGAFLTEATIFSVSAGSIEMQRRHNVGGGVQSRTPPPLMFPFRLGSRSASACPRQFRRGGRCSG
jgi:DNA replication and repair protein RecF